MIGVGRMGSRHLDHVVARADMTLAGAVDADAASLRGLGADTPVSTRLEDSFGWGAEAAVVAVPTPLHEDVVIACLAAGLHVLVEKPVAHDLAAAERMVAAADAAGLALMVGHIERHNLMVRALREALGGEPPTFVSTVRMAPHPGRSIADGVVLDSCIHDLDVVAGLLGDDVALADVHGTLGVDGTVDGARLTLESGTGCVAHLFATWRTERRHRTLTVMAGETVFLGDYVAETLRRVPGGEVSGPNLVASVPGAKDALDRQLDAFLDRARDGARPPESLAGLALALEATARLS